jgi:alcohol dehydrogenase class IV
MIPKIGHRLEKLGQDLFCDASAEKTIEGLESFFQEVNCPIRLGDIGISPDQKDEILSLMVKNEVNGKNPDNLLNDADREQIVDLMFAE